MGRAGVLSTCIILVCLAEARATHYVSPEGTNEYPYGSWEKAAHSIQDAIDASVDESPPDAVVVAPGDYVGNITLPQSMELRGAGAGSCTIRGTPPDEPWRACCTVSIAAGAVLSGFTVDASGCWDGVGSDGGEVRDCVVLRARSIGISARDTLVQGCAVLGNIYSGMYVSGVSVVYDTVVSGSWTGVYGIGDEGYSVLLHSTISGNGTGVDNLDGMTLAVRDSIVWGNSVCDIRWFSLPDVVGCDTGDVRFVGVNGNISADPLLVGWGDFNDSDNPIYVDRSNAGDEDGTKEHPFCTIGAALRAYDFHLAAGSPCMNAASDGLNMGAYPYDVPTRERSPSVLINVAPGTYDEGELMLVDGTHLRAAVQAQANMSPPPYDTALWLDGNSSIEGFSIGVNLGTAVVCAARSNPLIIRCRIFPYALDEYSAAVRAWAADSRPRIAGCVVEGFETAIAGSALLEGCTFVHNKTAVLGPDEGEGPQVRNSIIWSAAPNGESALVNVPPSNISHCLVSDPSLDGVNGNIFADPLFLDPGGGDFRLLPTSPCIDVGDNEAPGLPDTDIAGMHRIMYGGKSQTVDIGAYEYYINDVRLKPPSGTAALIWSSRSDVTYSVYYTADLLAWHLVEENVPSAGDMITFWTDDGSKTGLPPTLAPRRFYRVLENQ